MLIKSMSHPKPNGATWSVNGDCYAERNMISIENPVDSDYQTCQFSTVFSCDSCAASTLNDGECVNCPPGKAKSTNQQLPCEQICTRGSYSEAGAMSCTLCPSGYWQSEANAGHCTACVLVDTLRMRVKFCGYLRALRSGRYSSGGIGQNSSSACRACAAGRYSASGEAQTSASVCVPCLPGMFRDSEASNGAEFQEMKNAETITCQVCASGKYSLSGSASCEFCRSGFAFTRSDTLCDGCPPGKITS